MKRLVPCDYYNSSEKIVSVIKIDDMQICKIGSNEIFRSITVYKKLTNFFDDLDAYYAENIRFSTSSTMLSIVITGLLI